MSINNRDSSDKRVTAKDNVAVYDVEHLATFSTAARDNKTSSTGLTTKAGSSTDNASPDKAQASLASKADPISGASSDSTLAATTTPISALQRLFELEKQSGIWTQHMQIKLVDEFMLIADCESNAVVEKFHRDCVTKPEAFSQHNDIYNNIVVFILDQSKRPTSPCKLKRGGNPSIESEVQENEVSTRAHQGDDKLDSDQISSGRQRDQASEIHIFQCVSHDAQQTVSDILVWKSRPPAKLKAQQQIMNPDYRLVESDRVRSPTSSSANVSDQSTKLSSISPSSSDKPIVKVASSTNENVPIVNVNVKETVQVFNQIAALRERGMPTSPTSHINNRPLSDASATSAISPPDKPDPAGEQSNSASAAPDDEDLGGVQLYKQRSMRATLAPKINGSNAQPTEPTNGKQSTTSTGTSSSVDSSSSASGSNTYNDKSNARLMGADREVAKQPQVPTSLGHGNATKSSSKLPNSSTPKYTSNHTESSKQQARNQQARSKSDYSRSQSGPSQSQSDQVSSNESYVSVLNHCFDDIEKFIIRLQQSIAASRELLAAKRKASPRSSYQARLADPAGYVTKLGPQGSPITASEMALLSSRARGPNEEDYFEILSKFKLAFNLLAKLKGCIHEPNAPELVHFLFTPLAIIIESSRNALPQIDPAVVGIPYLNQDALDLLSNCCTSKESDLWMSLGPNWTQTIDVDLLKASRLPSSFQPIFSDGWAPVIGELELIGLVGPSSLASIITTTATMDSHDGGGSAGGSSAEACPPLDARQHSHPSARSHDMVAGRKSNHLPTSSLVDETPAGSSSRYSMAEHSASNYPPGSRQNRSNRIKQSSNHHQASRGGEIGSGLDYRRRTANVIAANDRRPSPDLPLHQHDHINARHLIDPYFNKINPVPYGYTQHETSIEAEQEHGMRNCYRGSANDLHQKRGKHSGKLAVNDDHALLGHNSRHHHYQHQRIETIHPNPYDPMLDYALADDGSHLEADLYRNRSKAPEDLPYAQHLDDHMESRYDTRDYNGRLKNYPAVPKQHHRDARSRGAPRGNDELNYYDRHQATLPPEADYLNEPEHEAMLLDLGPSQTEWFYELQSRGALIVRVLFTREANNDKELSVRRGELLEVLDDSRKWWRTRNIDLQVAHVPHTIVAVMNGFQTLDELLASNPSEIPNNDPNNIALPRTNQGDLHQAYNQRYGRRDDAHNSKTSGAFRYF